MQSIQQFSVFKNKEDTTVSTFVHICFYKSNMFRPLYRAIIRRTILKLQLLNYN
jgi:hypothetical protein